MTLDSKILQAVEEMRTGSKMHDDKRDEGLPTEIPEVERINDLSYGPDPKWNLLDIYLPKKRTGKARSSSAFTAAAGFTGLRKPTSSTGWAWLKKALPLSTSTTAWPLTSSSQAKWMMSTA